MIELDDVTLRNLQLVELELLCEVHRICTKCDIHYNIIAGTRIAARTPMIAMTTIISIRVKPRFFIINLL